MFWTCCLAHLSVCVSVCLYVASRLQRVSLIVIHSVCLSGCLSVIPWPTAYHDWSITTKFRRQVYTCPWTLVSLFGSPISHTLGARGKNMQNFAYFQHVDSDVYSCHCERDASYHLTCLCVCVSVCLSVCMSVCLSVCLSRKCEGNIVASRPPYITK